jgi:hypothetical protein
LDLGLSVKSRLGRDGATRAPPSSQEQEQTERQKDDGPRETGDERRFLDREIETRDQRYNDG